jgi:hypothetical protein
MLIDAAGFVVALALRAALLMAVMLAVATPSVTIAVAIRQVRRGRASRGASAR